MKPKRNIHGMWALLVGMIGSAVGTTLMKHSAFGLSAFYSVSLALYESTNVLTMGTWNIIYQVSLIVLLSILLRRFRLSYLASFLVVGGSSLAIDGCNLLFAYLPVTFPWRIGCFLAGQLILSLAISFLALCKLPVMPMNLFVRELADAIGVPFSRVKLFFDLGCLLFSSVVSLVFAGHLAGVGPGTILSVGMTAPLTGWFIKGQNKKSRIMFEGHRRSSSLCIGPPYSCRNSESGQSPIPQLLPQKRRPPKE